MRTCTHAGWVFLVACALPAIAGACPCETQTLSTLEFSPAQQPRGNAVRAVAVGDDHVYIGYDEYLAIIDVSDAAAPAVANVIPTGDDEYWGLDVAGDLLYVGVRIRGHALLVYDISTPESPELIASEPLPSDAHGVTVQDGIAYVRGYEALQIVDVTDPLNPDLLSYYVIGSPIEIVVRDSLLIVANYQHGLEVHDISDPASPRFISSYELPFNTQDVGLLSDTAYAVSWSDPLALKILDLKDPAQPALIAEKEWSGGISIHGERALSNAESFEIHDISDPPAPQLCASSESGGGHEPEIADGIAYIVKGNHDQVTTLTIIDISPCLSDPGEPDPDTCPADLDDSGYVDSADLNLVLGYFGCDGTPCRGDTDLDGVTDTEDLNTVLAAFGTDCPDTGTPD